ncbi:MAG: alpha-N-arabinofuranosidase [Candidatus Coatesbacteria bacterium]
MTTARIVIDAGAKGPVISPNIYGHFAEHLGRCVYEGLWVGEKSRIPNVRGIRKDVVAALRKMKLPVLRWPGGCFADEYHWMDGIGPRAKRPTIVNTHWGGVTENNHFGTHEFMDLCDQAGCAPYVCGNVGSGTVREMQQWVEYVTFGGKSPMADLRRKHGRKEPWKLPYFGVGNENWGCGGNMRPEYYADEYRRYQTYVRNFGDNRIFKIACGPNDDDRYWTEVLMREARGQMQGLSLHMYSLVGGWEDKGSATAFDESGWFKLLARGLRMGELVAAHAAIMDRFDPQKKVALVVDEWGSWYNVEKGTNPGFLYQQNTVRDALLAGVTLNIFNNHADRVRMANIAQLVNVLQAVVLTDGAKMLLTPTYHVFEMYAVHQGATQLPVAVEAPGIGPEGAKVPAVTASASVDAGGRIHLSLCHLDPGAAADVEVRIQGAGPATVSGRVLTAPAIQAHNTFAKPSTVKPAAFTGATVAAGVLRASLPPRSVVVLELF